MNTNLLLHKTLCTTVVLGVALSLTFGSTSAFAAKGAKLARVSFQEHKLNDVSVGVTGDGCGGYVSEPTKHAWDYWSPLDTEMDPTSGCAMPDTAKCDINSMGRWMFITGYSGTRHVEFHWPPGTGPNLDVLFVARKDPNRVDILFPAPDPDPDVDRVQIRICADDLFKAGVTRQSITLEIYEQGRNWFLIYLADLYVTKPDPKNPDLLKVSTLGPAGEDVSEAKLVESVKGPDTSYGTFWMPLTLTVCRTGIPVP